MLTHPHACCSVRDDPVIHAWDLVNEPRCEGDASGDILQSWLQGMATYIKSLDPHHALTVGLEGFYGPSTPGKQSGFCVVAAVIARCRGHKHNVDGTYAVVVFCYGLTQ